MLTVLLMALHEAAVERYLVLGCGWRSVHQILRFLILDVDVQDLVIFYYRLLVRCVLPVLRLIQRPERQTALLNVTSVVGSVGRLRAAVRVRFAAVGLLRFRVTAVINIDPIAQVFLYRHFIVSHNGFIRSAASHIN